MSLSPRPLQRRPLFVLAGIDVEVDRHGRLHERRKTLGLGPIEPEALGHIVRSLCRELSSATPVFLYCSRRGPAPLSTQRSHSLLKSLRSFMAQIKKNIPPCTKASAIVDFNVDACWDKERTTRNVAPDTFPISGSTPRGRCHYMQPACSKPCRAGPTKYGLNPKRCDLRYKGEAGSA